MSLTICIAHTDWSGPNPAWVRQPFLDGGRLQFDRMHLPDWQNVFFELGDLARVDSIAIGCRGSFDPPAVACLPIARAAYDTATPQPTLTFWADTVGLPDISHNLDGKPFDFANPQHIQWGWEHFVRHFFQHFGDCPLTRAPNNKVIIPWWGIATTTGHGFVNQEHAHFLLDAVDQQVAALGLVGAEHIVDKTWLQYGATNLHVFGIHNWFEPWGSVPESYSTRTHHGVTVGVVVPSFYDKIHPLNGETTRQGLAACRAANADVVILEGGTDFSEGAAYMRDSAGDTSNLDAVREHIDLTHANTPVPVPVPPEDEAMPTITATFCLRRAERIPHPTKPGYYTSPYPGKPDKVLSVTLPIGAIAERPLGTNGAWESWREGLGNRAVFDDVFGYTFAFPLED